MTIEKAIKQSTFHSEYHKLAVNLMFTSSWLGNLHHQMMKPYALSIQQFNVLRILRGQKGQALSINSLIERMVDKSSNASRIVDKLEEKKLVVRSHCPEDRRQVDVVITEAGLKLLAELDQPMKEMENIFTSLTEIEARQMNFLLDKMRN